MKMNDWLSFHSEVKNFKGASIKSDAMIDVYVYRESYIENFYQQILFYPRREIKLQLEYPVFDPYPKQRNRRIITRCYKENITLSFRRFSKLDYEDGCKYLLKNKDIGARRVFIDSPIESSIKVEVRGDLILQYCRKHKLYPILVVDSLRFSEVEAKNLAIKPNRVDLKGDDFHYYLQQFKNHHPRRPLMETCSQLCGNFLLKFNPDKSLESEL